MATGLKTLLALHGFLGLASDWETIDPTWTGVDLWSRVPAIESPGDSANDTGAFRKFARDFNSQSPRNERAILLGYSLGGRLALQAALQEPSRYSALILVSAHPGLSSPEERERRLVGDLAWANRFRSEEWNSVLGAWNAQPVLATPEGCEKPQRAEVDFSRESLARSLEAWSLARQPDSRAALERLQIPTLFVAGQADLKFVTLMNSLRLNANQQLKIIEHAGHRVPWDQPLLFRNTVREFLAGLPNL